MASGSQTGTIEFISSGFELYLPPTQFSSRFVMYDDSTDTFYNVDYETQLLQNTIPWADLAIQTITDPAIAFPPEQSSMLKPPPQGMQFATGMLVSVLRREGHTIVARKLGRVNVKPLPAALMSWPGLVEKKGPVLPREMRAGLMRKLWNRRPGARELPITYVASSDILDNMPRKWHTDGAALNYELDNIFSAGKAIRASQRWKVEDVEHEQIAKSRERAADRMIS